MLWERVRELTAACLVSRQVDPEPPIKSIHVATSRAADVRTGIKVCAARSASAASTLGAS